MVEIFFQDHGRGDSIDGSSGGLDVLSAVTFRVVQDSPRLLLEQTLRLPTGQAFVKHIHGQTELLAQAGSKARGFLGHFTAGAIEAEGQPHDDLADAVLARKFTQSSHVFVAIDALESEQRSWKLCLPISN